LLPKYLHLTMGRLGREDEKQVQTAMNAFLGKDVIVVYHESNTKYRDRYHDNYVNCTFAQGNIVSIDSKTISLKNSKSVDISDILDLIPENTLQDNQNNDSELKLFVFHSINPHVAADIYNVIHKDPVNAFTSLNKKETEHLVLSSVRKLYPGTQFNDVI
jgi:hypothetical protein